MATNSSNSDEQLLASMKSTVGGLKSWLTRDFKYLERLVQQAEGNPSVIIYHQLIKAFTTLDERFLRTQEAVYKIQVTFVSNDVLKKYIEGSNKDIENTHGDASEMYYACLSGLETALGIDQSAAGPSGRFGGAGSAQNLAADGNVKLKVENSLRPKKLTSDFNPVELSQWIKSFKAYYNASNMNTMNLNVQQSLLTILLDTEILQRIDNNIQENTEVLSESDGILHLIIEDFKLRYPIFNRRLDFFGTKQSKNESSTTYFAKLEQRASEADLAGITVADLFMHQVLQGLSDKELCNRLLNLKVKTKVTFEEEMRIYDAAQAASRRLERPNAQSYATNSSGGGGGGGNKGGGGKNKNDGGKNNQKYSKPQFKLKFPSHMKGKCLRCGSSDHYKDNCKWTPEVICKLCSRSGHIRPACFQKTPGNSRAPSRNSSPIENKKD